MTALSVCTASTARADSGAADALFKDAKRLMGEGHIAEACPKFEASFREEELLGALLNAADCREQQGRLATAWAHFGHAIDLATKNKDKRLKYATDRRAALDPRLPRLKVIVVNPVPDVEVYRGDQKLPAGTFGEALPVDPGDTVLQVTLHDEVLWDQTISLAEGQTVERTIDVKKIYDGAPTVKQKRKQVDENKGGDVVAVPLPFFNGQRIAGLVVGITGIVGAGVGFTFGGLALGEKSTVDENCATKPNSTDRYCTAAGIAASATAIDDANISQWTLIASGAVTAVGLTIFLTAPTSKISELDERADLAPRLRAIVPVVGPGTLGIDLQGAF
ncbi:MAG: hypothetical protein U0414_20000 [Polyangiaceae bacterium]